MRSEPLFLSASKYFRGKKLSYPSSTSEPPLMQHPPSCHSPSVVAKNFLRCPSYTWRNDTSWDVFLISLMPLHHCVCCLLAGRCCSLIIFKTMWSKIAVMPAAVIRDCPNIKIAAQIDPLAQLPSNPIAQILRIVSVFTILLACVPICRCSYLLSIVLFVFNL